MTFRDDYTDMALGLVSAQSFPAIVGIADHMLKSSGVTLLGYEKIGSGLCTAVIRGNVADVNLAIAEGKERAEQFGQQAAITVIPRPMPNLEQVLPIGSRLVQMQTHSGRNQLSTYAVGLLETRGFPALVGAADAMLKTAEVVLAGYETTGAGLCTAVIRGTVSNVALALDAGMAEADRIGELHAVMLVPRPLDDLDQTLPLASCWVEQPLQMPITIKETEKETVALPELVQEPQQLAAQELSTLEMPQPVDVPQPLEAPPPRAMPQELAAPPPEVKAAEVVPLEMPLNDIPAKSAHPVPDESESDTTEAPAQPMTARKLKGDDGSDRDT